MKTVKGNMKMINTNASSVNRNGTAEWGEGENGGWGGE